MAWLLGVDLPGGTFEPGGLILLVPQSFPVDCEGEMGAELHIRGPAGLGVAVEQESSRFLPWGLSSQIPHRLP